MVILASIETIINLIKHIFFYMIVFSVERFSWCGLHDHALSPLEGRIPIRFICQHLKPEPHSTLVIYRKWTVQETDVRVT